MNDDNINNRRSILELSNEEAKIFFMKSSSYNNLDLPPYFVFDELLKTVAIIINNNNYNYNYNNNNKDFSSLQSEKPNIYENVNYTLFNNKNGKYAWRPMQLIHPAIYVSLVNEITQQEHWKTLKERFKKFTENKKIKCLSLPVESLSDEKDKAEQVSQWWQSVEQKSIELALDFEYIFHTDIENCYGSIYTHSIAWALHAKKVAKGKRGDKTLIGNIIDYHIQAMSYGQTNGIPQGSVLMDFVAEMVLGYADAELSKKIKKGKIKDYSILRYRDDFRVFVNNPQDGEHILKLLTEVLIDLSMRLNSQKTTFSNDVIRSSIKADKLHWLEKTQTRRNPQKHLLIIHNHSQQFPNSGSLTVALSDFYKRLLKLDKIKKSAMPMIGIVVDISFHNPKTYPIVFAILSKLISFLDNDDDKKLVCKKIEKKFQKTPNTGYMQIWLQRISMFVPETTAPSEALCQLATGEPEKIKLWKNDWISSRELKDCLNAPKIIDNKIKNKLKAVISYDEIKLFLEKYE